MYDIVNYNSKFKLLDKIFIFHLIFKFVFYYRKKESLLYSKINCQIYIINKIIELTNIKNIKSYEIKKRVSYVYNKK